MNAERFSRLTSLFNGARALPAEERDAYLLESCAGDETLLREVQELLQEDVRHGDGPVDRALDGEDGLGASSQKRPVQQIGKYRLKGVCGSGGMGTVYEAEQESPSRRVALKVIRAGAMRPDLLRRFRRETKILARLQHPGIAQIFEAGEFDQDGDPRPFFAMEFIDGLPLTAFAEQRSLDVPARLHLFLQICDAIHYAHGQGVVHRDLKPENIFVQETSDAPDSPASTMGQPKILDFGVARLTNADARATIATDAGSLLGSVIYMSPEQAAGDVDSIDARSDLYSLGVVLFELLSGELPYDVRQMSLGDAIYAIRNAPPSRLGRVARSLSGDLETIVGKCLEKERERRYVTVAELSDDLRRFRSVLPISARPPSTRYQLQRFAQRNRTLVGGAAATALALIVGTVVAVIFALQSSENARDARNSELLSQREAYRSNLSAASALLETDPAHARRILARSAEADHGWEHRYLSSAVSGLLLEFGTTAPQDQGRHGTRPSNDMYLLAEGEQVVARSGSDEFTVWETRSGRELRSFRAGGEVDLFSVAKGGSKIVAVLKSGAVVVADPRGPQPAWESWQHAAGPVDALAISPDGEIIAVDRPTQLTVGRPGAWHTRDYDDTRDGNTPSMIRFSNDGETLAWLNRDLHVLRSDTGRLVGDPISSNQIHRSLAFSPDDRRVAAGQWRREIRAFDPETGTYDTELLGHNGPVTWLEYGAGDQLLSVSADKSLRVWNLGNTEATAIFEAPNTAKAVFLDEDHVLSLTGGRFMLWRLSHRRARELVGHEGHVFVPIFSPDGGLLATSAPWADLVVWDPLETAPLRSFPALRRLQFAFSASGTELIASHIRWSPYFESASWVTGETRSEFPDEGKAAFHSVVGGTEAIVDGHHAAGTTGALTVFRNEHRLGEGAGPPRVYSDGDESTTHTKSDRQLLVQTGQNPLIAFGGVRSYEFSGRIAELICFRGPLTFEDAAALDAYLMQRRSGANVGLPDLGSAPPPIAHFRASDATVERNAAGAVLSWQAESDPTLRATTRGRPVASIEYVSATEDAPAYIDFKGGYGSHRWLEASLPAAADAEVLTVCWLGSFSGDKRLQTAYVVGEIRPPFAEVSPAELTGKVGAYASFSRDGKVIADSWSEELGGAVTVRDRATGIALHQFEGLYWGIDVHPDSRRLACGGNDGYVDVFDLTSGERIAHFQAHSGPCYDLAFSPDGSRLATAGNDNALRLWDHETFDVLLEFPGHRSYVRGVAWSPDSTMLVSACGDYTVRIWDSVPRDERYAQLLVQRALQKEVAPEVESIIASHSAPDEALAAIRSRWSSDPLRLRASVRILARSQ